jgi:glycosyltransferase involved in cell wall biosynthesis
MLALHGRRSGGRQDRAAIEGTESGNGCGERMNPSKGSRGVSEIDQSDIIAVTLPVRNGAEYLGQAIDSLLGQSYRNIRLLVCDNASTDATPDIVSDYARRDDRVKLLRFEESVGLMDNHNRAWAHTDKSAQYFAWASDDDYWEPDFLAELCASLRRNPAASMAFCYFDHMNPDGSRISEGPLARTMKPMETVGLSRLEAVIAQIHTTEGRQVWYGVAPMHVALRRQKYVVPKFADDALPMLEAAWMGDIVIVPKVLFRFRVGGLSMNKHEDASLHRGNYVLDEVAITYIQNMVPSTEDRERILAELNRYIDRKNERMNRSSRGDGSLWGRALGRLRRWGAHRAEAFSKH